MFKRSCVLWSCQERRDEYEEGLRLYGRAVVGVEKVEEEVHVDFAAEDDARRGMEKEEALKI